VLKTKWYSLRLQRRRVRRGCIGGHCREPVWGIHILLVLWSIYWYFGRLYLIVFFRRFAYFIPLLFRERRPVEEEEDLTHCLCVSENGEGFIN
jgi:hypothetical protein